MANIKLSQSIKVLPAIPACVQGKAFFGGRIVTSHHVDTGAVFQDNYVSQGIFPDPTSNQSKKTLIKGMTCYFDLDLIDLFNTDEALLTAKTWFQAQGIETIHVSSDGRSLQIVDVTSEPIQDDNKRESARQRDRANVVKAYLTSQPAADLIDYCESKGGTFVDQLIKMIGKPNTITYTGTGLHMHYFIDESEGWTDAGVILAGDSTLKANRTEFRVAQKAIITEIGRNNAGVTFDKQRCDAGVGVTRDIDSTNTKHSSNTKIVKEIMSDRCDPNRSITLTDLQVEIAPAAKATSRKGSAFRNRVKGNTPSSAGHDKRVKREKARLTGSESITYDHNGQETTVAVDELFNAWSDLKEQGIVQDDNGDKLKCRLDWLSGGSLNAWVRADEDGYLTFICNVDKYLDPEDRHVFDEGGSLVGKWLYEGSLLSQLARTAKGALVKNTPNHVILMQYIPALAGNLRYNNRTNTVEVSSDIHVSHRPGNKKFEAEAKQNDWFPLTDGHGVYIKMQLEMFYGASVNKDELYSAIEFVAGTNGHDAVQEWLGTVTWDGRRRLDGDNAWLCHFMGLKKDVEPELFHYYEFIGRAMLLAIVRNIYAVEGHPVSTQHMALMRGNQNFGKSLMASVLAAVDHVGPQYFAEMNSDLLNRGSGDIIQALAGKTVIEIPELSAFSKKDAETVKNFITQRTVEGRKAYGRNMTRLEKATYMIGNTNKYKPLTDSTGARRFLMIDFYTDYRNAKVGTYQWDRDALVNLVPQLYAEAHARSVEGRGIPAERLDHTIRYCGKLVDNWNLTPDEVDILNTKNKAYTNLNAVTESVYDLLDRLVAQGQTRTTLSAIRKQLKEEYEISVQSNLQINEALSERNWAKKRPGGIRCIEFQGELTAEQEGRSVTHTAEVLNAPRDVAKSNEGSQIAAMQAMMADMKEMMANLVAENKELKDRLTHAEMRPEPRRKAPKKVAPKKAAPVVTETAPKATEELTLDSALAFLTANDQGHLVERYESITEDQPTRKARCAKHIINKAQAIQASL